MIELSKTTKEDLESLFLFQTNEEGIWMAAFMPEDPFDKEAYMKKWTAIVENPDIRMRTLRLNNQIIGSVAHFEMFGTTHVAYWIDRPLWGKGFATEALRTFIAGSSVRPLFARVAWDNYGSQKVLEKCGFILIEKDRGFANARKMEIEEFVYKLE
jgi:ribosomal-protein-alanine N-acetyltransferase